MALPENIGAPKGQGSNTDPGKPAPQVSTDGDPCNPQDAKGEGGFKAEPLSPMDGTRAFGVDQPKPYKLK